MFRVFSFLWNVLLFFCVDLFWWWGWILRTDVWNFDCLVACSMRYDPSFVCVMTHPRVAFSFQVNIDVTLLLGFWISRQRWCFSMSSKSGVRYRVFGVRLGHYPRFPYPSFPVVMSLFFEVFALFSAFHSGEFKGCLRCGITGGLNRFFHPYSYYCSMLWTSCFAYNVL